MKSRKALVPKLIAIFLTAGLSAASAGERPLPPDGGCINVKTDFGAKGDGLADDTEAIRAAIRSVIGPNSRYNPKFIYFPKGTYLVTDSIESRMAEENAWSKGWHSGMVLYGESREASIIQLKDSAPGFGADTSKAVIRTGSENPHGPDGRGNQGFKHSVINMSINTGKGNPGAVGIDYNVSNNGTIEFVTIRSGDGTGKAGLKLTRETGPGLVKDVLIDGFDVGIESKGWLYSMTFEFVTLQNQKVCGITNAEQVLSFRKLESQNSVPVIQATSERGLINLVDCKFSGGSTSSTAIENAGKINIVNLVCSGYGKVLANAKGDTTGLPSGNNVTVAHYTSDGPYFAFEGTNPALLNLPREETPDYHPANFALWANASTFPSLQAAIDSGKEVIYIPAGSNIKLDETLILRGNVRKLMGLEASISKSPAFKGGPLIRFADGKNPEVIIEHLKIVGDLEDDSSRSLAVRHGFLNTVSNTSKATGKLFLEDMIIKASETGAPLSIWARQLNVEGGDKPVLWTNNGGKLWILGYKTENAKSALKTTNGGSTELFGALFYLQSGNAKPETPGLILENANMNASFAQGSNTYPTQVSETRAGAIKRLNSAQVPKRGNANICAFFAGLAK